MNEKSVSHQITRMLLHSAVWAIFSLYVYHHEAAWNQTFLSEFFLVPYAFNTVTTMAVVYFAVLNSNLYLSVLGKKNNLFGFRQIFAILIITLGVVLFAQWAMITLSRPFHFGLFGYFYQTQGYVHIQPSLDFYAFLLYALSLALSAMYAAGMIVYFIQVSKMRIKIGLMGAVRFIISLFLLGLVIGETPTGFNLDALVFSSLYIFIGVLIYLRFKYSLRALVFAILVLFLI